MLLLFWSCSNKVRTRQPPPPLAQTPLAVQSRENMIQVTVCFIAQRCYTVVTVCAMPLMTSSSFCQYGVVVVLSTGHSTVAYCAFMVAAAIATLFFPVFPYFFVSVPCARVSWPSCHLLSACKCNVFYRGVWKGCSQESVHQWWS